VPSDPVVNPMERKQTDLQRKTYELIFGTDTTVGWIFDLVIILAILISVAVIMLDSIPRYHQVWGQTYIAVEWGFTLLFTLEYALRIWCSPNRKLYITSAFGIVDLLAILPTYLALYIPDANSLLIIRLIRILRIFRVLRLVRFLREANVLARSLSNSRRKIFVFFSIMLIITVIFGCLMYVIEGPANGFGTIPKSIYWAIVTITTVGYGDVVPQTALGQFVASIGMLTGYAIIAVPTGILTAEMAAEINREKTRRNCKNCERTGHDSDAAYCKYCGAEMGK
jgi:voltage-gated potassium channel